MTLRAPALAVLVLSLLTGRSGAAKPAPAPLRLLDRIELPGVTGRLDHLAFDTVRRRLYVAALGNGSVEVVDLARKKRVAQVKGLPDPQGIAYLPETDALAVACGGDGTVRLYRCGETLEPLKTADLGDDADNVRYVPGEKRLYVGYGLGGIAALDAGTLEKLWTCALDDHPEAFEPEPKGPRIFVNVPGSEHVAIVDREKKAVVGKLPVPAGLANYPMALDGAGSRLYVGCRQPARVLVFDAGTGHSVGTLEAPGDVDDLFLDEALGRLYAVGGAGVVRVFSRTKEGGLEATGEVETAPGARTALFVPSEKRLYVAVPRRGGEPAEVRAFETMKTGD